MKRVTLLNQLGFSEIATNEMMASLKSKKTKTNKEIVSRIEESELYKVFKAGERFTVASTYKVTTIEIKQLEKIFKGKYILIGTLMDESGLWSEWTRADQII